MIHYLADTAAQINQQNRIIYSFVFVLACAWLTLLFFSEGFRDQHKLWLPGGVKTAVAVAVLALVIAVVLLH